MIFLSVRDSQVSDEGSQLSKPVSNGIFIKMTAQNTEKWYKKRYQGLKGQISQKHVTGKTVADLSSCLKKAKGQTGLWQLAAWGNVQVAALLRWRMEQDHPRVLGAK